MIASAELPGPARHDPAAIAELYERPVAPPPFSGTQIGILRLFGGPLKVLARLFYRLAVILDRRLQENRNEAFHRLTQEVAHLRREVAELRESESVRSSDRSGGRSDS